MPLRFPSFFHRSLPTEQSVQLSLRVVEEAYTDLGSLLENLDTYRKGLSTKEVKKRLKKYGWNEIIYEKSLPWYLKLLNSFHSPFVYLLLGLAGISYLTGDLRTIIVLMIMVLLSGGLRFLQEYRSSLAAEKLRSMVSTTATVSRRSDEMFGREIHKEVPIKLLVPGDIVHLSAGDMVPADIRLLTAKDFWIDQAILTGESSPIQKHDTLGKQPEKIAITYYQHSLDPLDTPTVCFMGTTVVGGTATGVVVATGNQTYLGSLTKDIVGRRAITSFDRGVNSVSWLLLGFMTVLAPVVFLINGIINRDWGEAFFFGISVAVGLTPEMLPMIVSANLARGAMVMASQKVIIKHLNAVQNLGAMDILCTDKTGTLTQDQIIVQRHLNIYGEESNEPLHYAYLNSYFQTSLKNLIDEAILAHAELDEIVQPEQNYRKVAEIPFDFVRRRLSVVLEHKQEHILICKGAVEEIAFLATCAKSQGQVVPMNESLYQETKQVAQKLNAEGFRVIAVGYKRIFTPKKRYSVEDECHLTLVGYLTFLDPPRDTALQALNTLKSRGIKVKIITGDNETVTRKICQDVGLEVQRVFVGSLVEQMSDEDLAKIADMTTIFAKMTPLQKARVIRVLKQKGYTVGYMGDGINDALVLREADVGISVDSAVDVAKESANIILLDKSLLVLEEGIVEGRRTFGNIIKYLKMAASSNFGNVFSVVGASALLPFLPMQPIQLLIQNLLYDISQTTIPFDRVDEEYQAKPQKWNVSDIGRFMVFIGSVSSIFDYATYAVMWFILGANTEAEAALFQSGWFVEGLLSQTLIIHMIRSSKIPIIQSMAALPVIFTTVIIMTIGVFIPFTSFGRSLGMVPLPQHYFPWLVMILLCYFLLMQVIKIWYIRRFQRWL
ncbi:MAG: magnesium-translocating P-type ATPase [Fischerella sp.]|nr:magnesium-translocating P-type ATPase [Fischerella sp.]